MLPENWEDIDVETACLDLLENHDLLTHPGYFYNLPNSHLVTTFLQPEETFQKLVIALEKILRA